MELSNTQEAKHNLYLKKENKLLETYPEETSCNRKMCIITELPHILICCYFLDKIRIS